MMRERARAVASKMIEAVDANPHVERRVDIVWYADAADGAAWSGVDDYRGYLRAIMDHLLAAGIGVDLIEFDGAEYDVWRRYGLDTPALRAEWASQRRIRMALKIGSGLLDDNTSAIGWAVYRISGEVVTSGEMALFAPENER